MSIQTLARTVGGTAWTPRALPPSGRTEQVDHKAKKDRDEEHYHKGLGKAEVQAQVAVVLVQEGWSVRKIL